MKKFDIVHTTILIVAILCGYSALQQFLGILSAVFYASDIFYARSGIGSIALPTLISTCTYVIAAIILVKNSKRIANFLMGSEKQEYEEFLDGTTPDENVPQAAETIEPTRPPYPTTPAYPTTTINPTDPTALVPPETPEAAEWHLDRRSILFALFIGIGLYTMIEYIPALLNSLLAQFRHEVASGAMDLIKPARNKDSVVLELLRVTIGAFLIYAAPNLTNFIEKTIAARLHNAPQIP
jgi:hypothetical protein